MSKRLRLFLLMLVTIALLTGCEAEVHDLPELLQRPIEKMYLADVGFNTYVIYLDDQESELAEKCFDSVCYQGVTLALPMNVSDLPDGYTIKSEDYMGYDGRDVYSGYTLQQATIYQGDRAFMAVEVLYKKGDDINNGQITAMYFSSLSGIPVLGEGVITKYTTSAELAEKLGTPEAWKDLDKPSTSCYYVLKDGRMIYVEPTEQWELTPYQIHLIMDAGSGW